jgi:hypothetical protein
VTGGPAEAENARFVGGYLYLSGPSWKIRVPGYGLIFAETGRGVKDLQTGEFVFNSGHNQFLEQDLAALCAYLK